MKHIHEVHGAADTSSLIDELSEELGRRVLVAWVPRCTEDIPPVPDTIAPQPLPLFNRNAATGRVTQYSPIISAFPVDLLPGVVTHAARLPNELAGWHVAPDHQDSATDNLTLLAHDPYPLGERKGRLLFVDSSYFLPDVALGYRNAGDLQPYHFIRSESAPGPRHIPVLGAAAVSLADLGLGDTIIQCEIPMNHFFEEAGNRQN